MPEIRKVAPAKLNLTLEIVGNRGDGYHELRSVITAIDLCDTVTVDNGHGFVALADEAYDATAMPDGRGELNTVETALALAVMERSRRSAASAPSFEQALRQGLTEVGISLRKRIPAAAGLGGGSSDATAALAALSEFWDLGLGPRELERLALVLGSDCPFFARGGAQLVSGRGEILEALPMPSPAWFCLLMPPLQLRGKTGRLYSLLREAHYSDGQRTARLAERLRVGGGRRIRPEDLYNTFDAVADEAFASLEPYRLALHAQDALAVHLCGSGPALYALCESEEHARRTETSLLEQGFAAWTVGTSQCFQAPWTGTMAVQPPQT